MTCRCDTEDKQDHGEFCEEATITKGEVVEMMYNGSGAIIDEYLLFIEAGNTPEEAKQNAVQQAGESVSCYLQIGSCGSGGCHH